MKDSGAYNAILHTLKLPIAMGASKGTYLHTSTVYTDAVLKSGESLILEIIGSLGRRAGMHLLLSRALNEHIHWILLLVLGKVRGSQTPS